ncbi:UNVERIFIED_CONTAM: hypothetical protein Sindi_2667100 [Sesamum indicum]
MEAFGDGGVSPSSMMDETSNWLRGKHTLIRASRTVCSTTVNSPQKSPIFREKWPTKLWRKTCDFSNFDWRVRHRLAAVQCTACIAVTDSTRSNQWWCACDPMRRSNFPTTNWRRRGGDAAVEEEVGCFLVVVVRLKEW